MTRLADLAATRVAPGDHFSALINGEGVRSLSGRADQNLRSSTPSAASFPLDRNPLAPTPTEAAPALDATRKFEAYVIQSFLQNLLPQGEHGIFGQGTAGSVWRSMVAEQLGNQLAKAGGIGLHKIVERHWAERHAADGPAPQRAQI
ncbi:MAG: rod-binding protein [Methylocystis sp.]|nr:rod-binding protein [Methylocystis sp.]